TKSPARAGPATHTKSMKTRRRMDPPYGKRGYGVEMSLASRTMMVQKLKGFLRHSPSTQLPVLQGVCASQVTVAPLASVTGFCPEAFLSMPVKVAGLPTTIVGSNVPTTFCGSWTEKLVNESQAPPPPSSVKVSYFTH